MNAPQPQPNVADHPRHPGFLGTIGLAIGLVLLIWKPNASPAASNLVASSSYRLSATAAGNSQGPSFSRDDTRVLFLSHAPNLVTNEDLGPHLNLYARTLYAPANTVLLSQCTNGYGGANASISAYVVGSIGWSVAFETSASNLTANDTNGVSDIFTHSADRVLRLVSVNASGTGPGNGRSFHPLISRYGERVVFESEASDLVPNDTNGVADIFVRSLPNGPTRLVSLNFSGAGPGNGPSGSAFLSEYGTYVAFVSRATDLVLGVTNRLGEVYIRDLVNQTTRWAMAGLRTNSHPCLREPCGGLAGDYQPSEPITFDDGHSVIFRLGAQRVVHWQFASGPIAAEERVHTLAPSQGDVITGPLMVDAYGSLVGYVAAKTNAAGQITNSWLRRINFNTPIESIDPRDGSTNLVFAAQDVVSAPVDGQVFGSSMSVDGARFIFASDSTRLLNRPMDGSTQIYYHEAGAPRSVLVSARSDGSPGPDLNGVIPSADRAGRKIAWETPDASLVNDDLNRAYDIFVRDYGSGGQATLISARHEIRPAMTSFGASRLGPAALSGNGRVIAFSAFDGTIVADDTNGLRDAFAVNLASGVPQRLTVATPSAEPRPPALNANGRFAVFEQVDFFLAPLSVNRSFRADLLSNTVVTLGRDQAGRSVSAVQPSMSDDGRFVAFQSTEYSPTLAPTGPNDSNGASDIFIRDFNVSPTNFPSTETVVISIARHRQSTGSGDSRGPIISSDGRWVAFLSLATDLTYDTFPIQRYQIFVYNQDRAAVKLLSYTPNPAGSNATALSLAATNPVFSADGRFVFFTVQTNLTSQRVDQAAVFRHDLVNDPVITVTNWTINNRIFSQTNLARLTNTLVCTSCANPVASADGRFVAYEAAAADGQTNAMVRDLQNGESEFVSPWGNSPGPAHRPLLSWDGRYVVFTSRAAGPFVDVNGASDIFVHDRRSHVTHLVSRSIRRSRGSFPPFHEPLPAGDGLSDQPVISADGRVVAFQSFAHDLISGDFNGVRDVFVLRLDGDDRDGDGLGDDWEVTYFSSLAQSADMDPDEDGHSNLDEFRAGTDPTDSASVFQVLSLTLAAQPATSGTQATVFWSAVPGRLYRLQTKAALEAPWENLPGAVIAYGTSATKSFNAPSLPPTGFIRAVLLP